MNIYEEIGDKSILRGKNVRTSKYDAFKENQILADDKIGYDVFNPIKKEKNLPIKERQSTESDSGVYSTIGNRIGIMGSGRLGTS